jgi:hypothetical protein
VTALFTYRLGFDGMVPTYAARFAVRNEPSPPREAAGRDPS